MNRKAKSVFWASSAALALFTAAAGLRLLYGFDLWLMRVAQARTSGFLDTVGGLFSTAGGIKFTVATLIIMLAVMSLGGRLVLAVRILIAFLAASAIEVAMKFWVPVTPLPDEFSRSAGYDPLVPVAYPYPYPSGHMLRTTILLGVIFVLWKNRAARALILLALIGMSLSRVYMGVHWASDVIGGILLGVAGLAWAFGYRKGGRPWR
ncbi:MAG: phosphatase PAP2 family protein [Rubrobacteraceae bacterium]